MSGSISRNPSPPGLLDETLAGTHGVEAIRRLALGPIRDDRELRLIRTKFKPARKLSAYYVSPVGLHTAMIWTGDSVTTMTSPDDPAMPELARIHERLQPHLQTLRYRPAQRHVLSVATPGHRHVHLKIDRDDSGARSVPIAHALGPHLSDRCPDALIAEPVEYVSADRMAVWQTSSGVPLAKRLDPRLVHLVGRAVRVLHDVPLSALPEVDGGKGSRDARAEVAATIRAAEHIQTLLPAVGAHYLALVEHLSGALDRVAAEAPTFTHGDLKSDNVLTTGSHVRLLDLDRCGAADPALDLGKFVADLRWWSGTDEARASELVARFRDGYGDVDPERWERAELLAGVFALKLAARRCAVHDETWESDVRSRVAAATPLLARGA